jgi:hypothetical protein
MSGPVHLPLRRKVLDLLEMEDCASRFSTFFRLLPTFLTAFFTAAPGLPVLLAV